MADENKAVGAKAAPQLFSIEDLKARNGTKESVWCAVISANGWCSGKMVTEDEYQKAVATFLNGPANGKEVANA